MAPWPSTVRECLAVVVGEELPAPDAGEDEPTFWRQWLAQRNLGLVPVADPAQFAWPGQWLAFGSDGDGGRRAVVMFGSPSGVLFDAGGAAGDLSIDEGYVVAPLDLHLDRAHPYDGAVTSGTVEAVLVAPDAEAPLRRLEAATALAGAGLEGDRYALRRGTFSGGPGKGRDRRSSRPRRWTSSASRGRTAAATSSRAGSTSTRSWAGASGSARSSASPSDSPSRAPTSSG